jgi:hydroxyethylthiazole kinase-like uncharacterized protein yjeF
MKILSQQQVYEADRATMENEPISSFELMERAATQLFDWLHRRLQGAPVPVHIFCGIGNNGGDGLVLARHLFEHGYHVQVYVVAYSPQRSPDFSLNLEALKARKIRPLTLEEGDPFPQIAPEDIVVDAIFGIGLNRPPAPWIAKIFESLNQSGAFILSIDIPSGLHPDTPPGASQSIIRADQVLTFNNPKLSFFLPESGPYLKDWTALDIVLDTDYLAKVETSYQLLDRFRARTLYRPRDKYAHKGTFGHAILAGGSYGKIGAVRLAAEACLKSGAGLVTAWVPECGYQPLQTGLPEVMVQTAAHARALTEFPDQGAQYTLGVGMGMGTAAEVLEAFRSWLPRQKKPLLIDADGLNLLSKHPELLDELPEGAILTPHPGEFKRLAGDWKDSIEKLQKARSFAGKHRCVLVLKGAHTMVCQGETGYINTSGNPGMATAGSGDVLSGMLTGLLAQGYPPLDAAMLGVYLHGRAGDIAAASEGYEALTASSILTNIGRAFVDLFTDPGQERESTDL